jgi:hypothetical protein
MSDVGKASPRRLGDALGWARAEERRMNGNIETLSAPAFRALVAERLRSLERDVAEVRTRINGLLFVVVGAVITQLVLRLTM